MSLTSNVSLPFVLFIPSAYNGSLPAPLVVVLHGLGGTPQSIMQVPGLVELSDAHGFITVAPMGFSPRGWYGAPIPESKRVLGDPEDLPAKSEADVLDVIAIVTEEFRINRKRIYLLGNSMGGGGAWHLAQRYPERWAAIAAIAPAPIITRTREDVERLRDLPVIIAQGSNDLTVPPAAARLWAGLLRAVGVPHKYVEVPGGTHKSTMYRALPAIFSFFERHPGHSYAATVRVMPTDAPILAEPSASSTPSSGARASATLSPSSWMSASARASCNLVGPLCSQLNSSTLDASSHAGLTTDDVFANRRPGG